MLTVLASLVFLGTAIYALGAVAASVRGYRDVALANVAALRGAPAEREFRFATAGVMRQPVVLDARRRQATRKATAASLRISPPLRAAA